MSDLRGRRVVIVGGGSGIGEAVALALRDVGAVVTIVGRDAARLETTRQRLGAKVRAEAGDVSDEASAARLFTAIGPFDDLVTTAATSSSLLGVSASMADMPMANAERFMAGKFWTQYRAARAALPHLSARGTITFTSGVASRKIMPRHTVIAANNAALEAMAKQLAREVAPRRVNVVSPGLTSTATYDHLPPERREAFFAEVRRQLPTGEVASAADVAEAYLFVLRASALTGAVVAIDGGFLVS